MDSKLLYPIIFLIWGGVFIFFTGFLIFTWDKYNENVCIRKASNEKDKNYYNKLCLDQVQILDLGILDDCNKREHSLHKTPEMYAMIDTLDVIGLCYNTKCEDLIGKSGLLIPLALGIPCVILLILLFCGCELFRHGIKTNTKKWDQDQNQKID